MPKTTKAKKANKPEAKKGSVKKSPVKKLDYRTVLMGRACFFCGNIKDVVRIKKNATDESEDAKYGIFDYTPCDECKKKWEGKTVVIGYVTKQPADNRPAIPKGDGNHPELYPTGSYVVMERDAITRVFNIQNPGRCMFAEEPVVQDLIKQYEELKKKQGENNA